MSKKRQIKVHELKTDSSIFNEEVAGMKPWMLRVNDRDFQEGDIIVSRETKHTGEEMKEGAPLEFTGNVHVAMVTYIQQGPFYTLPAGTCIMAYDTLCAVGAHGEEL